MKKALTLFLALALLCGLTAGAWAESGQEQPELVLTYVPAYGSTADFQGYVRGSADPARYRITLYVQLGVYDQAWVKPSEAAPYYSVRQAGSFTLSYSHSSNDKYAVVIHILLIPGDYWPTVHGLEDAKNAALDYVKITRTAEGEVTVSPDRYDPSADLPYSSGTGRLMVNVGFYIDGGSPGQGLSTALIARQLDAVMEFASVVRFYRASGELYPAYQMAHSRGLSVMGSAFLNGSEEEDRQELDTLIAHCNSGYASVAIVGNETMQSGCLTEEKLLEYMTYVRARLTDPSIPVTTSETLTQMYNRPELCKACDFLLVNQYPFLNGCSIAAALDDLSGAVYSLQAKVGDKQVVVGETGFPTAGGSVGRAVASEENAAAYFESVWCWSLTSGVPVVYFAAADEPWKAAAYGGKPFDSHWGFMTTELTLKSSYANTGFFQSLNAGLSPRVVRFSPGDGAGGLLYRATGTDYQITLPECPFSNSSGMEFAGWLVDDTVYQPGEVCRFTSNATVIAQWTESLGCQVTVGLRNGQVCANVYRGTRGYILIASYAADGKMLDCQCSAITETGPSQSFTETFYSDISLDGAAWVRVFCLDGGGQPLSRSKVLYLH